ncbi:MAG: hypothetical protein JST00_19920 [Deltaproteobacteria bacterium]|nr:hypothetical protein [Deltaproteobacteria bacterium]
MPLGFELRESFSGSFYRLDDPRRELAIRMSLRWAVSGLRRFVRQRKVEVLGTIWAEGIAERGGDEGVPLQGIIVMRLFDEKRMPYDLGFEADDGTTWQLRGQRDFFVYDAVDSLTILPASLYDGTGKEAARATLRFDPKTELPALVKSFRPRVKLLGGPAQS